MLVFLMVEMGGDEHRRKGLGTPMAGRRSMPVAAGKPASQAKLTLVNEPFPEALHIFTGIYAGFFNG